MLEKVITIIKDILDTEESMNGETHLLDDLAMDSISMLYLQIAIEDKFNVKFDPLEDEFEFIFSNINNLCVAINKKIIGVV
ncbi:acyl carrier protein [Vallitalea sp.]|jgi:acyl carrier protein|uniref:acyl carrier protein n=1 Tax=Vallitalea sp. TaxID=1882829 RepID=UPI0025FBAB46|nr:acyl carrier protein [Vallitalea sp.]MCT4688876.1 acyl carrier protein [Vallitalea sp.]